METSIEINLEDKVCDFEKKYDLYEDYNGNIKFQITTNKRETLNSVINDYENIIKNISELYNELITINFDDRFNDYIKIVKDFLNKDKKFYKDLYEKSEYIFISGALKDIKQYIKLNPELKTKKIILSGIYKLENSKVEKVRDMFYNEDNIYIKLEGNEELITIKELDATLKKIDEMVLQVKKYDFSPLEQLFYVYDKVRDKIYVKENDNEDNSISRDLTKVLLGDKIVCKGYANIFNAILKKLGFKTDLYCIIKKELVNGKRVGHARNIVLLNDKKYAINGVYFDTTWDCKRNVGDNSFLYSYKYFAKTKNDMEYFDQGKYIDYTLPFYDENMVLNFIETIENEGLEKVSDNIIETINYLSKFIDGKTLITPLMKIENDIKFTNDMRTKFDSNKTIDKLISYDDLFNKPIVADILLKALYNVRKNEYYEDEIKYPFDLNSLYSTVINSNWIFKSNASSLLMAIFGCEVSKNLKDDTIINVNKFINNNEIDRKIETIKLSKTLRKVLDKKEIKK